MGGLWRAWTADGLLVYFIYGLAFFSMGLLIAAQNLRGSRLRLSRAIWYLALFGLFHAFSEWADVFLPLQARVLPAATIAALRGVQLLAVVISFLFLIEFGAALRAEQRPGGGWERWLALPLGLVWLVAFLSAGALDSGLRQSWLAAGQLLARLLLLGPGAALSAAALVGEARRLRAEGAEGPAETRQAMERVAGDLRWTAGCLVGWAAVPELLESLDPLAGGLGRAPLLAALDTLAIPAGVGIAVFTLRTLEIFRVEEERRLEQLEQTNALMRERNRIASDLHDGAVQILYAIGMQADAGLLAGRAQEERLAAIKELAQKGIAEIRAVIHEMGQMPWNGSSLAEAFRRLPAEVSVPSLPAVEVEVRGEEGPLPVEVRSLLYRVAREAFVNACKHSRGSRVRLALEFRPGAVRLAVADDGQGIDPATQRKMLTDSGHFGLSGLAARLGELNGTLEISSRPGQGTVILATVPLEREREGEEAR
ncbi:MAG: histidine kinase [Bacillota bacterium]|nr:histidine kinase [Bacillota bacterium]